MYLGVKNIRLHSLTAAQLDLPRALGGSSSPVSTIKLISFNPR